MIQIRKSTSLLLLLGTAAFGCGARRTTQTVQPTNACVIDAGTVASVVRVALTDPVDLQHAPVPRNDSERLLFRQLYQTLVSTDCNGNIIPELAESWLSLEDGRIWVFRLRTDATFWDGTPVTPHEVMRSWSEHGFAAAVTGMRAVGERELRVELRTPTSHVTLFANPDFAVARRDTMTNWPIGSGAFRVDDARMPHVVRTISSERVIEFHLMSGTDPRAALDAGWMCSLLPTLARSITRVPCPVTLLRH